MPDRLDEYDEALRFPDPELIEIVWAMLSRYINGIDCTVCRSGAFFHMNSNQVLEQLYNREIPPKEVWKSVSRVTPKDYSDMVSPLSYRTFHYRSNWTKSWKTGYHKCRKNPSAEILGMGFRTETHDHIKMILLGIDIDCHNGEEDRDACLELVHRVYPGAYHERSTSGTGYHVYVRVAVPAGTNLGRVYKILEYYNQKLQDMRSQEGVQAKIDSNCGLPTRIWREEQTMRISISHRSLAIKIPRFDDVCCGERGLAKGHLDAVVRFVSSPVFLFGSLEFAYENRDPEEFSDIGPSATRENQRENSGKGETGEPSGSGKNCNILKTCVLTPEVIDCLRGVSDGFERKQKFAYVYTRHLRCVPTVDELNDAYVGYGLANTGNTRKRNAVFKSIRSRIEETFDEAKLGGVVREYAPSTEDIIAPYLKGVDLGYADTGRKRRDGTGREKVQRALSVPDVAVVYWGLWSSCRNLDGSVSPRPFSYAQAMRAYRSLANRGCARVKMSAILRVMQEAGLVEKTGNYLAGSRGNVYRPLVELETDGDREATASPFGMMAVAPSEADSASSDSGYVGWDQVETQVEDSRGTNKHRAVKVLPEDE